MKILQLCSKIPFPPTDGGTQAMHVLTEGLLNEGHEVTVLAMRTHKHNTATENIDADYRKKTNYQSVFIDTRVNTWDMFLNLFSTKSYNITRFYSDEFNRVLIKLLSENNFDVVHLETLYASPYVDTIRKHSKAKIVLRSQNVEFMIWKRLAVQSKNPLKRAYFNFLAKRLKRYEVNMLNKYDAIATITGLDEQVFRQLGCTQPIITIPFGVDITSYVVDDGAVEFPSVFHLGAMNWLPNVEGVKWFINEVWPLVYKNNRHLKLYLAGRHMPHWLTQINVPNVVVVGEVDDAKAFINSKAIMVVPLLSGGGMRIKIIEGMALGKFIIATAVAAEGIAYEHGKNIIVANSAHEFAQAILTAVKNKDLCLDIGKNARLLAERGYDNAAICKKLSAFYETLV